MPHITILTSIKAPKEIVFDLSRNIDLHKLSTSHTKEDAISGVTSGLIGLNESVTWKAKHFGIYQTLTSKITEFEKPNFFVDEMVDGVFKSFRHEHMFEEQNHITLMRDNFVYKSPFGILGKLADLIFLKRYMTQFLISRNKVIKDFAESGKWKMLLNRK